VRHLRLGLSALAVAVLPLVLRAQSPGPPNPPQADVQLQFADLLFTDGRYAEARDAYRRVVGVDDSTLAGRAAAGVVRSILRTGAFRAALSEAAALRRARPDDGLLAALHGDALWAAGMFDEADAAYDAAMAANPSEPRARHGRARSLMARSRLSAAVIECQEALRLSPRDGELHNTLGSIYLRMHRYQEASAAFGNYLNLLPNRDRSEKAMWARELVRFLDSFKDRHPYEFESDDPSRVWTVPVKIERDKVFVRGKVNGVRQDFVLDTGAEQTVISRELARRAGVAPITYTESAGVGEVGFRGLQIGRIDLFEIGDLKVRHVPGLIKNPPLGGMPGREPDSFSPLAFGLSMRLDYQRRQLVIGRSLPAAAYTTELPLRMYRLATVRGTINGSLPASFVVDTGGEVISISGATAEQMPPNPYRRIPLRVYGTSGWDKDAFLMPYVDLEFSSIRFSRIPVVVLNLRAPSALLGYELGGIVGHKFLSKYRVSVDLEKSVLGLE
jgi:Flp pilus assembly protein TadD/predicted aspartyl protease